VSLIVLASAKGAPGVTVTSLALAAVWPRPVLVAECDPAGGDLAPRWGLPPAPSMLTLAAAARRRLDAGELWRHTQRLPGSDDAGRASVLLGPPAAEQALALGSLWGALGPALAGLPEADVLADCGRLLPGAPSGQLLGHADLVLLVARPSAEGIAHARTRLLALQEAGLPVGLVLVGQRPYGPAEVREALDAAGLRPSLVAAVADDPRAAGMLAGEPGSPRRLATSLLIRSARALLDQLPQRPAVPPGPQHPLLGAVLDERATPPIRPTETFPDQGAGPGTGAGPAWGQPPAGAATPPGLPDHNVGSGREVTR